MSTFRVKCPGCGEAYDVPGNSVCRKCGSELNTGRPGMLRIYRMGSPIGVAAGFGIYLNGQPYGHVGNKQTVYIPLPYGEYNLHVTCGMSRKCRDLKINITPDDNYWCVKVHINPGFWSNTLCPERADPASMPND